MKQSPSLEIISFSFDKGTYRRVIRYGPDGPRIERQLEWDFPHPFRTSLAPNQPPVQWVPALLPGVKRPGIGVDHPPPSSAEDKERVEIYLYNYSGPSWSVTG